MKHNINSADPISASYSKNNYSLFILFIHFSFGELIKKNFNQASIDQLKAELSLKLQYLQKLLSPNKSDKWQGYAYIFIDDGYNQLLKGEKNGYNLAILGANLQRVQHAVDKKVEEDFQGKAHFKVVTSALLLDLLAILENNSDKAQRTEIKKHFTGGQDNLLYDGSKSIEAVVRIANIGRNVPILRFDDDVIFLDDNSRDRLLSRTRDNIIKLCRQFQILSKDPEIDYFMFSGSYLSSKLNNLIESEPNNYNPKLTDIINGLATRVLFLTKIPPDKGRVDLKDPIEENFKTSDAIHFLKNLWEYGANPFLQVVSGAGLCLSDSAIMDLPPFSNMSTNVMWIDDHLKYSLHHELRHFGFGITKHSARFQDAWFHQIRHKNPPNWGDVMWHINKYMERLILGCIADDWLRGDPRLKKQLRTLSKIEFDEVITKQSTFASTFSTLLLQGRGNKDSEGITKRNELKDRMWDSAIKRIHFIRSKWQEIEYKNSFLELFVLGSSHPDFDDFKEWFPTNFKYGLLNEIKNLSETRPSEKPPEGSLNYLLYNHINDFVGYIDFVIFWRYYIQSTRFLLNWKDGDKAASWLRPPNWLFR